MPTNRSRRTRKIKQITISPALRSYFETGSYDGPFPEEDRCDAFLLSGREADLKVAWDAVKDEILADWKRSGKRGRPWAAKQFDHETKGKGRASDLHRFSESGNRMVPHAQIKRQIPGSS